LKPATGKLVVLEGIDGSGKRTQMELLARTFKSRSIAFSRISFPNYHGFFGALIARFLNGDFGSLGAVDPHFSALLYAGDRLESRASIESVLAAGGTVLADRYIGSNLAHQGARVALGKRSEFLQWLKQLEYEIYALPPENLVIYLRVPADEAHRLIAQKGARDYTELRRDLLEDDLVHLEAASEIYDELARQRNWVKIECFDAKGRRLRGRATIREEILRAVETRIFPGLHRKR
jgi:dTMP kinase